MEEEKKSSRENVDKFVRAYHTLLEENRELKARRTSMLNLIKEQRHLIVELKQQIKAIDARKER